MAKKIDRQDTPAAKLAKLQSDLHKQRAEIMVKLEEAKEAARIPAPPPPIDDAEINQRIAEMMADAAINGGDASQLIAETKSRRDAAINAVGEHRAAVSQATISASQLQADVDALTAQVSSVDAMIRLEIEREAGMLLYPMRNDIINMAGELLDKMAEYMAVNEACSISQTRGGPGAFDPIDAENLEVQLPFKTELYYWKRTLSAGEVSHKARAAFNGLLSHVTGGHWPEGSKP